MKTLTILEKKVTVEMSMGHASGYGQYRITAETRIENEKHTFSFHSTDSELYDERKNDNIDYDTYQDMLFGAIQYQLMNILEEVISTIHSENE